MLTAGHEGDPAGTDLCDYSTVTAGSIRADLEGGLADAEEQLSDLVARPPADPFAVVAALDDVQAAVFALQGRTAFLDLVHPDERVREAASEARAKIAVWESGLLLRDDVADIVAGLSAPDPVPGSVGAEGPRLLAHWKRDLRRTGHGLPEDDRDEVRALRGRLAEIETAYQNNITADDTGINVTQADTEGLPNDWFEGLGPSRAPGAGDGSRHVSIAYPELGPFLAQAHRRDLRRELLIRFWSRAAETNRPLLEEGLAVRRRIAELLGYPSWADYATEVRMAGSAARVTRFLEELTDAVASAWDRELAELHAMLVDDLDPIGPASAEADGRTDAAKMLGGMIVADDGVCPWDLDYLLRARAERRVGMSPSELAEYFPAYRVVPAMLDMMGELFGLEITEVEDASVWHPDVTLFAIADRSSGKLLGYVYLDLFTRDGKYSHGQACKLTRPRDLPSGRQVAVSALVLNSSPRQDGLPALLRHDEIVALFHEFGHVVHQLVTHTRYFRFSGTNVEKDFVEAPSRLMERWAWDLDVLQRLAHHHATGQAPSAGTLERLTATRFNDALYIWVLSTWLSRVDLDMHAAVHAADLDQLMRDNFRVLKMPYPDATFIFASIEHVFAGYDAGYYSYQWAEVIGDTMVARLERDGLLDPRAVTAFRTAVLEPGGSFDGDELVERFLGEQAGMRAFLTLRGWEATSSA